MKNISMKREIYLIEKRKDYFLDLDIMWCF